jgi:hypothetical protein
MENETNAPNRDRAPDWWPLEPEYTRFERLVIALCRPKVIFGGLAALGAGAVVVACLQGPARPPAAPAAAAGAQAQAPKRAQVAADAEQVKAAVETRAREQAQARADAVDLLGAAGSMRQAGDLGLALELGRQAVGKAPDYAEAQTFVKEVEAQRADAERARVAAVAEYRGTVERRMRLYKDASVSAASKTSAWWKTPILSFDNDWTKPGVYQDQVILLTFALGHWELTAEALADISPVPPEGAAVQARLVAIAAETKAITRDVDHAVRARDQQALTGVDARIDRLIRTAAQTRADAAALK